MHDCVFVCVRYAPQPQKIWGCTCRQRLLNYMHMHDVCTCIHVGTTETKHEMHSTDTLAACTYTRTTSVVDSDFFPTCIPFWFLFQHSSNTHTPYAACRVQITYNESTTGASLGALVQIQNSIPAPCTMCDVAGFGL
jgi:hypothetical protein